MAYRQREIPCIEIDAENPEAIDEIGRTVTGRPDGDPTLWEGDL